MDPSGRFQEDLHPLSYPKKKHDEDTMTYAQAMSGAHAEEFQAAMSKKIQELKEKQTWTL